CASSCSCKHFWRVSAALCLVFFYASSHHRRLPSFPTRRSSDLIVLRKNRFALLLEMLLSDALFPAQNRFALLLEMLLSDALSYAKTASHFCWKCLDSRIC